MTELQKFSPSSLKHTPKKSAITIPPRVIELMEKVSLAAACLSREFQEMTMASEGERQANMLLTIDNFLSEIDTLFLCKIEDISETIPKELFQKIQDLRNFTEQAFIYFIEKGQLEFIGSGTEGAAHRLKVATKEGVEREFIVLKKSHFIQGDRLKNEFEIQEQAHIIASRMHGVEVPRPYMNFSRGEEHYLVMEYIPGKTLYTLQLEQVANKIVLERIFRTIANDTGISEGTKIQVLELLKEFYTSSQDETKITAPLTTPLYGFFERHNQENPIRFENDTVAEEKLMQLLQIAYQINAIDGDPMKKVLDPQFWVEVLELATRLYRMNEKKFPLFLEKESTSIARSLRAFFTELHKKGIYHRDFHPRNIMMGFDGNIRVIDFGYAKSHPSSPYAEEGGGERIDDLNLVNYIAAKKIDKHTPKMDLLAPKIAKQQLLLKNFNFRKLSEHIGLSPKDLELAATLNSYVFSPTFLTNQFDQLVSKKAGVNWEILLKPRGDAMKNSAKAEARWAFAFALLSDAEYEQFITCITALYRSWSPTKKSRADNILKRLALWASIVEWRMLEMR